MQRYGKENLNKDHLSSIIKTGTKYQPFIIVMSCGKAKSSTGFLYRPKNHNLIFCKGKYFFLSCKIFIYIFAKTTGLYINI